jgi:hypothetical protein
LGTVPLALVVEGLDTVIQVVLLVAVQVQEVCTPNELVPPAALMVLTAGCSVMEQTAAPCVTGMEIPVPVMDIEPCWLVGRVLVAME